jgi:TusA-related sulfurtransferase
MEIIEFKFSKDDSCHKLSLKHPVYQIMEALGRLKPGQAVRVGADDFDWAQTIEIVTRGAGYSVVRERDNPPVLLIWK